MDRAVADIAALSPACRKVLANLVEAQTVTVEKVSACLERLFDLGFAHIQGDIFSSKVTVSLWGEEALDAWEDRRPKAPAQNQVAH